MERRQGALCEGRTATAFEADRSVMSQYRIAWRCRGLYGAHRPKAWKVVDGKLYLNYSKSVQKNWEKDIPGHITAADGHWPGILAELSN